MFDKESTKFQHFSLSSVFHMYTELEETNSNSLLIRPYLQKLISEKLSPRKKPIMMQTSPLASKHIVRSSPSKTINKLSTVTRVLFSPTKQNTKADSPKLQAAVSRTRSSTQPIRNKRQLNQNSSTTKDDSSSSSICESDIKEQLRR